MKLKKAILTIGLGLGLALPIASVTAGGTCQRCEAELAQCAAQGYTWQECYYMTGGCVHC